MKLLELPTENLNLVIQQDGVAMTNSLLVAEIFEKNHKDVLRSINSLEVSDEFRQRNFAPANYTDAQGKPRPMFQITRDGFTMLAMGFTGKKAIEWKEKYIQVFNQMEARLRSPELTEEVIMSRAIGIAQRNLGIEIAKREQVEQKVQELLPYAQHGKAFAKSDESCPITVVAKERGVSARAMNTFLHQNGIQFFTGGKWVLYQKYADKGYTRDVKTPYTKPDGTEGLSTTMEWTERGAAFIHWFCNKHKFGQFNNTVPESMF